MISYNGVLDLKNQKGKFVPILLENGELLITTECEIIFNMQPFHINEYFGDVPEQLNLNMMEKGLLNISIG